MQSIYVDFANKKEREIDERTAINQVCKQKGEGDKTKNGNMQSTYVEFANKKEREIDERTAINQYAKHT